MLGPGTGVARAGTVLLRVTAPELSVPPLVDDAKSVTVIIVMEAKMMK